MTNDSFRSETATLTIENQPNTATQRSDMNGYGRRFCNHYKIYQLDI